MESVAAIRDKFPCPSTPGSDLGKNNYCVGGAFLLFWHGIDLNSYVPRKNRFPDTGKLLQILLAANPALNRPTAEKYARDITWQNDKGRFETAWIALEMALKHQ